MNYKDISLKLATDYSEDELRSLISKKIHLNDFSFEITRKSLDARKKGNIFWLLNIRIFSEKLKGETFTEKKNFSVPYKSRSHRIIIVGNGPAGMFSALLLQKAGFQVTILERGADVELREKGILHFEKTGIFDPNANYAFGEGGAGTFSDGKLTSRSRHISFERSFIVDSYIKAGAPTEIKYLSHPHLGTDNLRIMVKNLRNEFLDYGGKVEFNSFVNNMLVEDGIVKVVQTETKEYFTDSLIIATGHSSYDTYRMLMQHGVNFKIKNYAIGARVEHPQELINTAQWGVSSLNGVKAAEYRLTSNTEGFLPSYTFCMCPGGIIVPATAVKEGNIVNGMSNYQREGLFSNAACVAAVNLEKLLGKTLTAENALRWTEDLEYSFYRTGYKAPACSIHDFLTKSNSPTAPGDDGTSYPMGLESAALWELLPLKISNSLRQGLKDFSHKLKGFEKGTIMGLESKTSAPIQVLRDSTGLCEGFSNLYMTGEGSGFTGGIISSASDGLKTAMGIMNKF